MDNDDPFADIDSATPKSKKSENRAILRDARKKASVDLYKEFDDPELDLIRKPANPYVFIASFGVFILAMIFGLKPMSFIATGQGEYAVQVNIAIIDNDLVQSECRPVGKNKALENSTVVLSGIPGSSDISLTEKLAFADATLIENANKQYVCYFEVFFPGVRPIDGNTFNTKVILPNKTFESVIKLDPSMSISITLNLD